MHGAFGEYSSQAGFTLCVRGWGGSGVTWASHHANPASGQRKRAPARRCPHVVVRADTGGKARCLMRGPPGESAASRGHEYPRDRPQRRHPPWVIVPRPPTKKRHVGRSAAKTWHHRTPTATGCSEVHWARVLRPRVAMKAGMTPYGRMPNGYLRRKAALRHLNERRFTQSRRQTTGPVKGVLYCAPRAVRRPVQRMHSGQRFPPRGGRNPLPYPALTGGRAGSDWGKRTGFGTPTTPSFQTLTQPGEIAYQI